MRRINPFDSGARDNFPGLSPLKPPKAPPLQATKDLSYGPSDDDASFSSYDDDLDDHEHDNQHSNLDINGDDFDDDEDVVIDAGGSGSGSDVDDDPVERGGGLVRKNIALDWSIDTLATVKPAEISINDEYSTDEEFVSPTKLQIKRVREEELQRKSTEYFEKGKFTTTPKEVHTMPVQHKLHPPEEDMDEYSDDEEDDLNMRTPIKYGRERTYDEEIDDVNQSIHSLQKKFQDLLESADSSSDTGPLHERPADSTVTKDDDSEMDDEVDRDLDRDYHALPTAANPKRKANLDLASDDEDVQFGSDLELDSDLDLDDQDLDAHHLASLSAKPMTSTPMKPPLVALKDKKVTEELKEEADIGKKKEPILEKSGPKSAPSGTALDAGSELSELNESLSDLSDLDQDLRDEQLMHPQARTAPAVTRVTSSFLTQLDKDESSDLGDSDLDVDSEHQPSATSLQTLKKKETLDIHPDSDLDDSEIEEEEDDDTRNLPNPATPIYSSSPIFSSSPITDPHSPTPYQKKVDFTPFQSTPSSVDKQRNFDLNQITPIKSAVNTPSSPIIQSTLTPVAASTPMSSLFKLQSTPSHPLKSSPADPLVGSNTKNSSRTDPLASPNAALPLLRQATLGRPEVRKQLDMDVGLAGVGRRLERRDLDAPSGSSQGKLDNLQDHESVSKNSTAKPPAHGLAPIPGGGEETEAKVISGKKDLANLLAGFTYDDADIAEIRELGDFIDHETGEVHEQRKTVGTSLKQLQTQEKDIGFSPIKGILHSKDYFGPVAAEQEEDEEELLPNILDESGNETTIVDEESDEDPTVLVDEGEVDAREERARLIMYNGIRQSIASNDVILKPQNVDEPAKSGNDKDDISTIIAKYINLKHPPEEINDKENNFNKRDISDSASLLDNVSENSAAGVRRKLAERDKELAEILKDDDVSRDGRSTLSTSALRSIRDDYLKAPYTQTRYSSSYLHASTLRPHSTYSRYSPLARPDVSPERYRHEPTRYSNAQAPVYMPPYSPPPYPTYMPPGPYSPIFRPPPPPYVPVFSPTPPSYMSSYSNTPPSYSYPPSYTPSYIPTYSPSPVSYGALRTTSAYTPSPPPLPSHIPYSPPRYSPSPLPTSHPRNYAPSSFTPLPPSSSLSSSVYYPSTISYTASKYATPARYGL